MSDPARPLSRRQETSEESRRRILDAAETLFLSRGVDDTTFARVEREAGISRGSIPWHFKNKLGLLMAVVERAMLMATPALPDHDGRGAIRELVERLLEAMQRPQADLLVALLAESLRENSISHDRFKSWHEGLRTSIADAVTARPEETPLPEGISAETFATMFWALIIGVHQQWRLAPDLIDLDELGRALVVLLDLVFTPADSGAAGERPG